MNALDAIDRRRSIRAFDPDHIIPKEQMDQIIKAACHSPTANNSQEVDIIVVHNNEKINKASDIIYTAWPEGVKGFFDSRKADYGVQNVITCDAPYLVLFVLNGNEKNIQISTLPYVDTGIMTMALMVAASSLGLDTLCLGSLLWGNVEGLEEYLEIPKGKLAMAVALGKTRDGFKNHEIERKTQVKIVE